MLVKRIGLSSLLASLLLLMATASIAAPVTLEDIAKRLDAIEAENKNLRSENENLKSLIKQTDLKADAAVAATETISGSTAGLQKLANWADKTSFGGYGELHYNNLSGKGGADDKDSIDFHRFVLFFGHEFSDSIRFFSEVEIEHGFIADTANGDTSGEVELEQAYIDFDLNDEHTARAGLFLLPVGIINETHEPPTFYGTERNAVEKNIIPSTWWAAGAGVHGQLGSGFSYDAYVHSGLALPSSFKIRSGRQKVSKAKANDPAVTARIKYTGIAGLELAMTVQHQQDMGQGEIEGLDSGLLVETHAIWNTGPFTLKALYAQWDIDGSAIEAAGMDKQVGLYIEPSYKISEQFGVFTRFSQWDNKAGSNSGSANDSQKEQWDIGVNYWPHEDVVIKADYQYQNNDDAAEQNGLNLGIGYQF